MRFRLIPALALGVAAACSRSALPHEPPVDDQTLSTGSLVASAGPGGVSVENRGSQAVRFSIVDSLFFENGLASWCIGQDDCGASLAAGGDA
jgi:hypothetical protein